MSKLNSKVPKGPLSEKWTKHKNDINLVNPANKRKKKIIVVGTGLAGASAAASLAELGYQVQSFCFQDSPRRAHSIAAQGGINAAKNYPNDGDSVWRLFYDTVKGGDFRSREANVHRLAQVSNNIIDQCAAQGVPFARDYGGLLANRSFGGAQVSRTFYARGQTGQQLLLGAYSALMRQVGTGRIKLFPRREMLELVVVDGVARGDFVTDATREAWTTWNPHSQEDGGGYGLGLSHRTVDGHVYVGHTGGDVGAGAFIMARPDAEVSIVGMTNLGMFLGGPLGVHFDETLLEEVVAILQEP